MRSCREITELVSRSLDVRLTWRQRLAVRLHLMLCDGCRNFKKQMRFLREVGKRYPEYLEKTGSKRRGSA